MEEGYLIDTNTAIDYLDNRLPTNSASLVDGITAQISVITRMELFGLAKCHCRTSAGFAAVC